MSKSDGMVIDVMTRIFQDLCDPRVINGSRDMSWRQPAWDALEDSGLTLAWVPEHLGGAGASLTDGFAILQAAGTFAVPVPLSETMLAGWLLAQAGLESPKGPMTVAPQRLTDRVQLSADGTLSGFVRKVPFAPEAEHIVVLAKASGGYQVALVDAADCRIAESENIGGDAQGDVCFDGVAARRVSATPLGPDELYMMGAATRTALIAGSLEAILDITVGYANERVAFGRPIGKFQAIQHHLATLGCEAAAAAAVAGSVADTFETNAISGSGREALLLEAAGAKIRAGEAAGVGAFIAHQVHGAIGFTREYVLHRFTRRMWAWRDQFGSESEWALRLGQYVVDQGGDALWPLISSR